MTCICLRTLKRWRREFKADGNGIGRRRGSSRQVAHRLRAEECQRILVMCNEPKYVSLPPAQIAPDLADQGIYKLLGKTSTTVLNAVSIGFCMPTSSCITA